MKFRLFEQHAEDYGSLVAGLELGSQLCRHYGMEYDAASVCQRGGAFSNNELTGDSGEFVTFHFDRRMTFQENVDQILARNPGLSYPSADAWWSIIKGGPETDKLKTLKGCYLINPSNRPLEKIEGCKDYRLPVLVFRSKEDGYSTDRNGWFLSTLCTSDEGRINDDSASCLIYFKTNSAPRLFDLKSWLHFFMTGRTYRVGRNIPEEPTSYAKLVIAKMSDLKGDVDVEKVRISNINTPLHCDNPSKLPDIERTLAKADELNVLTDQMFQKLVLFAASNTVGTWKVIGPNTVAEFHGDFTYSGSGGSSYYSILRLWHNGDMEKRSYCWRDGRSASHDRPDLQIVGIGETKIDGKKVTLELLSDMNATRGRKEIFTLGEEFSVTSEKQPRHGKTTCQSSTIGRFRLLHDKDIIIRATNGDERFTNAERIFTGQLHPDFKKWRCGESLSSARQTRVQIFEMVENGTLNDLYRSPAIELDSLCLTESQIIEFVRSHHMWLRRRGFATFFLFKNGSEFLVARIQYVSHGYLYAKPYRLSHDKVWDAKYQHRFVLPVRD